MIVADANILLYRIIPNPRRSDAENLARLDCEWAAPALWRSEVRSGLMKYVRIGQLTIHDADVSIQMGHACLLGGEHTVADRLVFNLAAKSKCSTYDCEYVVLAEALNTILVTEDAALRRAFPERCRSIAEMLRVP